MKQITITVPDNCELKQDGNTYTIVEKEKKVTYDDIAKELFGEKPCVYIDTTGKIVEATKLVLDVAEQFNNCTSKKQAEKLLAINKLMNVAKYLNGDWQPDWTSAHDRGWYIFIKNNDTIKVSYSNYNCGDVYFRTDKLAKQAIEILGEGTIKLALCTDY